MELRHLVDRELHPQAVRPEAITDLAGSALTISTRLTLGFFPIPSTARQYDSAR
jgi:hypothetical protein